MKHYIDEELLLIEQPKANNGKLEFIHAKKQEYLYRQKTVATLSSLLNKNKRWRNAAPKFCNIPAITIINKFFEAYNNEK